MSRSTTCKDRLVCHVPESVDITNSTVTYSVDHINHMFRADTLTITLIVWDVNIADTWPIINQVELNHL